jgi:hypothetical protein
VIEGIKLEKSRQEYHTDNLFFENILLRKEEELEEV